MKKLKCSICGSIFEFTDQEIDFYRKKEFEMPKRCLICRKKGKMVKKPYIEKVTRYIKQSTSYSVNFFGFILIPKYAVYGRWDNSYFYVDNFEQFLVEQNQYKIHIIKAADKNIKVKNMSIKNPIMRMIRTYIESENLYKVKCFPVLPRKEIEVVAKDKGNKKYGKYSDVKSDYFRRGWFVDD